MRNNPNILYGSEDQDAPYPLGLMRTCLSVFYQDGIFLESIKRVLADHDGAASDEVYWYYEDRFIECPDGITLNPNFGKVSFYFGCARDTVCVSEELSLECAKDACERFMKLHQEEKYRKFIIDILDNWVPFDPETMD